MRFVSRKLKAIFAIVVLLPFISVGYGQSDREKAVEHPLECAYYLLTKDKFDSDFGYSPTQTFFRVGWFDRGIAAASIDDEFNFRAGSLLSLGVDQAKSGDPEVARRIADLVFDEFVRDIENPSNHEVAALAELLALTSQPDKLDSLIDRVDADNRIRPLTGAARAFTVRRQRSLALALLDSVVSLPNGSVDTENGHLLLDVADLYSKNGRQDRAIEALRWVRTVFSEDEDTHIKEALYRRFYLLGSRTEATAIWKSISAPERLDYRLLRSSVLIEAKERQTAEGILDGIKQSEFSRYPYGQDVVKQYLLLGRVAKAESVADRISTKPDSYDQQDGYMQIADHYIAAKNGRDARRVLEKAFGKARKIEFVHLPQHSVGASPGSRKSIFLREIAERFQKLGALSKALVVLRTLNDEHPYARELLAASLGNFANTTPPKLPRKLVLDLLAESLAIARKVDGDVEEVQIMAAHAEVLAKFRDRNGATNKLAELLESRTGEYLEGYALLLAGEVFEKYKLPLNNRLQSALTVILEKHELA